MITGTYQIRPKTIKKFVAFFITFFIVQIIIAATTSVVVFASEIDTGIHTNDAAGNISGSVWNDNNQNDIREINERVQKTTIVYLRVEGYDLVESLITDADGYFTFNKLSDGDYTIWAEDMDGNSTDVRTVELREVSGVAEINLTLMPILDYTIFCPLVMN